MSQGPVLLERSGRAATVRLNRPPLNILDIATIEALDSALAELANDSDVQLVVLRGAGGKAFSAGVSIQDHTPEKVDGMLKGFHGAIRRLRDLEAVTLAAIDGHCLGGGMELAFACDMALAAEECKFGLPEILLGCYPPVAAAMFPQRIGTQRAFEMALTGRNYTSAEILAMGLLNACVPKSEFEARLEAFTGDLLAKSGAVLRLTKRALRAGESQPFRPALHQAERIYLDELCATADIEEGIQAFLEKRTAVWKHR
ncbi:MAG: enoyl-CoA hydratase-related protein [Acidobacteriota bacterium]